MAEDEDTRVDRRHCPRCGAMGILPLDQPKEATGPIKDPVMLCPVCGDTFRATGTTWLGASRPPDPATATDEDIERWASAFVDALSAAADQRD